MSKFYMAGTDGTGEYKVVAVTSLGRVGYRNLSGGLTRVRVEPASEAAAHALGNVLVGWKQPDENQFRLSVVLQDGNKAIEAIEKSLMALGCAEFNPDTSAWREELGSSSIPEEDMNEGTNVSVPFDVLTDITAQAITLAEALRALRN